MTHSAVPEDQISPLEELILKAFRRALSDEQSDVAEHLLRALETLQPNLAPGSSVANAYRAIADRTINGGVVSRRLR
ncbi:protein of unknown function (plasmid) [Pseudorhizobium banfieldiae]|uniref:Uncharacterized protein n=1 Tax=Pseudorhizobium banfieldiae TaxID=1125847 RepID=L0NNS1_9HYPH|nr:hypothetical protein [Pseudorhizobium banfieldiae]CAD6631719.1 hypothetical protein RNT25_04629 [arsenite-oxidising bacterium NT-25]CCF22392.1 protein of unknown function [Pseudorhizobium banfieldiae]